MRLYVLPQIGEVDVAQCGALGTAVECWSLPE